MRSNIKKSTVLTHGGANATVLTPEQMLRRSVMANFLFENEFYEDGESISERILRLVSLVSPEKVSEIAIEARTMHNMRHVPLLLASALARHGSGTSIVSQTIEKIICRADELAEFVAVYAKINGVLPSAVKSKLSKQVKVGLANAFTKFDEYSLSKYDRAGPVRLRDVMFMSHPTPKDDQQADVWKRLINNELTVPDTWEVALSGGASKKETFTRMLQENKLGYFALIRNLRGMVEAGVDHDLVVRAILARQNGADKVLPFRFLSAVSHAPKFRQELNIAFRESLKGLPRLSGHTVIVVDVSGSMNTRLSAKSEMTRMLAGCSLASLADGLCESSSIYATAGNDGTHVHKTALVNGTHGLELADKIANMCRLLGGGGIFLRQVMTWIAEHEKNPDRVLVITDEQDCGVGNADSPANAPLLGRHNYMMNVASARNGIGNENWLRINGFSDKVFDYIRALEG